MDSRYRIVIRSIALLSVVAAGGCTSDETAQPRPERWTIEWCRLQAPALLETTAGRGFSATGRVRVPGLTDLTPGSDLDPDGELYARVGWGPYRSIPNVPNTPGDWTWKPARARSDWDDSSAEGEAGVDEYRGTATAPDVGRYSLAFAFSGNAGQSWTLCDLGEGSMDGFAPEDAGKLVVLSGTDPCEFDPCGTIPPPACDGTVIVQYDGPGTCVSNGINFQCEFPSHPEADCAERGRVCVEGACVAELPVDFCQHLGPTYAALIGEPLEFEGLVRVTGITDRTIGVDSDSRLKAEFGYGPIDSLPGDGGWQWPKNLAIGPAPDWTEADLPDESLRGSDVYRATLNGAPAGTYDTAWRFSSDGGATWTYCDLDGSHNGYNLSAAGRLWVSN